MFGLIPLAAKLVGAKFAKPLVYGGLIVFAVLALWGLKSCYDSSVIENARNRGNVEALERKAAADEAAANRRLADERAAQSLEKELSDAVADIPDEVPNARRLARACAQLRNQGVDTASLPQCQRTSR